MDFLIIASVLLISAGIIVIIAKSTASHKFKCRHCSGAFSIKWTQVLVTEHSGSEYKLVCPLCKSKGWCTALPKDA